MHSANKHMRGIGHSQLQLFTIAQCSVSMSSGDLGIRKREVSFVPNLFFQTWQSYSLQKGLLLCAAITVLWKMHTLNFNLFYNYKNIQKETASCLKRNNFTKHFFNDPAAVSKACNKLALRSGDKGGCVPSTLPLEPEAAHSQGSHPSVLFLEGAPLPLQESSSC